MRTKVIRILALPLLAFLTLGANCPLIPKVEDRVVELALLHSTSVEFQSQGQINYIDKFETVDLHDFNLGQILEDAGVNVSDCKYVKVAGAAYVTTEPELGVGRRIENASVTIQRVGGPVDTLVSDFDEWVNEVLDYKTATLNPAGVSDINAVMADLLTELKGGPIANAAIIYHFYGNSLPALEETDFKWKLRLDISVVGTVKVKVLN